MTTTTVATVQQIQLYGGTLTPLDGSGPPVHIGSVPLIVGREESCGLVIRDRKVSQFHAELVATPQGVHCRDLGSRNGTYVDKKHRCVEQFLLAPAELHFGDTVYLFTPGPPLTVDAGAADGFGNLIGGTQVMRRVFGTLRKLAATELTTLITGETGTGKELVAQAIHTEGRRGRNPFMVIDCAAIPPSLAEAILFGHERGAFTGAAERRISPFIRAEGGTVFLDEIGELPTEVQPKLLRVLQERKVQAVGGEAYRPINVRVIAATRRDLRREANAGVFRGDLFYRLVEIEVAVPPLRERVEDIPALIQHFARSVGAEEKLVRISQASMARMLKHDWPGNVRELRNVVVRTLAMADPHGPIDLGEALNESQNGPLLHAAAQEAFELRYWRDLWGSTGGNISKMKVESGRSRQFVRKMLDHFGLRGIDDAPGEQ